MTAGFIGLTLLTAQSSRAALLTSCFILGAGMGCQMLSLLLAIQHGVERSQLGVATSLNQFSRSIGAAVGVAAMGALMSRHLAGTPMPEGVSVTAVGAAALSGAVREQFAAALHRVFLAGAAVSGAGLIGSLFLPHVDFAHRAHGETPRDASAVDAIEPADLAI